MFRSCSTALFSILLLQVMFLPMAGAAVFPDVSDSHLYREAIKVLVGMEVINGNPDGNFYPERTVNRAEMLKMLYKAAGRVPGASKACFPDVQKGSWYESYVCDAAAHRFVQGYSDGLFRPERTVNRVEAIKMITEVLNLRVPELTEDVRSVMKFVDVSLSGWYTKYLYSAFKSGLLPIAGQDSARFYPDQALLRGESAAYIHSALNVKNVWEEVVGEMAKEELSTTQSTTDWKTYRNDTYGYEFKYPADWEKEVGYNAPEQVVFYSGKFIGDVLLKYADVSIEVQEQWPEFIAMWNQMVSGSRPVTIGGIPAFDLGSSYPNQRVYGFLRGSKFYSITTTVFEEVLAAMQEPDKNPMYYQKILDGIPPTFRIVQ